MPNPVRACSFRPSFCVCWWCASRVLRMCSSLVPFPKRHQSPHHVVVVRVRAPLPHVAVRVQLVAVHRGLVLLFEVVVVRPLPPGARIAERVRPRAERPLAARVVRGPLGHPLAEGGGGGERAWESERAALSSPPTLSRSAPLLLYHTSLVRHSTITNKTESRPGSIYYTTVLLHSHTSKLQFYLSRQSQTQKFPPLPNPRTFSAGPSRPSSHILLLLCLLFYRTLSLLRPGYRIPSELRPLPAETLRLRSCRSLRLGCSVSGRSRAGEAPGRRIGRGRTAERNDFEDSLSEFGYVSQTTPVYRQ